MMFKPLTETYEWNWVRSRTSVIACEDSQGIVAHHMGEIKAIAVFDSFTVDACNVHLAIDSPFVLRHGFLNEIARHLFSECGRERIFGLVPSSNEKALKLDMHIGMKEVARVPNAVQTGVDYIVLSMEKVDCRWLNIEREAA